MTEYILWALVALGVAVPLLPRWRALLFASFAFVVANPGLLAVALHDLGPNPGPGRGVLVLFAAPTIAFLLAASLRTAVMTATWFWNRSRRARPGVPGPAPEPR